MSEKEERRVEETGEENDISETGGDGEFEPGGSDVLFNDISADNMFTEMQSLCMNCEEQGVTRLLLTKIPFFKEIVIMAFTCPHCGYRSNEIQSAGQIQDKGVRIDLRVGSRKDLNRQVVKSEWASIKVPELDFEIPPSAQRGTLNTIEGFLRQAIDALAADQPERERLDPESAAKMRAFLDRMAAFADGNEVFHVIVDDPSGNSFIENPYVPLHDPDKTIVHYTRTAEQSELLGLNTDESAQGMALKDLSHMSMTGGAAGTAEMPHTVNVDDEPDEDGYNYKSEVIEFPGNCSSCHAPTTTRMKVVDIPYFKEVVIMSVNCDQCGYKSNDVKGGGAIPAKGVRLTLKVTSPSDMSRSVLSSTTSRLLIPERDIEFSTSSSGGRFTTLEGLLDDIVANVKQYPFLFGDSTLEDRKAKVDEFQRVIDELKTGTVPFTFIIEDPAANSFIQNLNAPQPDPALVREEFERSWAQNEELGLNDIHVDDTEGDSAAGAAAAGGKQEPAANA